VYSRKPRHGRGARRGDTGAAEGLQPADRAEQREGLPVARRRTALAGRGQRDAQHPQHHVGGLEAPAGVEEGVGLVAQHRPRGDPPEQRRAVLDVADERVRAAVAGNADRRVGEAKVDGVDRLPHLGADHVAHRARALARTLEARDDRVGVAGSVLSSATVSAARGPAAGLRRDRRAQ